MFVYRDFREGRLYSRHEREVLQQLGDSRASPLKPSRVSRAGWKLRDVLENGPFVSHLTHLVVRAAVLSLGLGLLLFDIDLEWNEIRLDDGTRTTQLGSKWRLQV